jgi:hypothetical protein
MLSSSQKTQRQRSRRRFGRAHSLHVEHPAQMGAAHQEPRRLLLASGLTMEHAIGALERELARESLPKGRDTPSPLGE